MVPIKPYELIRIAIFDPYFRILLPALGEEPMILAPLVNVFMLVHDHLIVLFFSISRNGTVVLGCYPSDFFLYGFFAFHQTVIQCHHDHQIQK